MKLDIVYRVRSPANPPITTATDLRDDVGIQKEAKLSGKKIAPAPV
jgi:hypothetical protein